MLRNPSHDAVYFDGCKVKAETAMAVLVVIPDLDKEVWIPKSQLHDDSELACKGDEGTLAITEWFAEKEGL
jgi:hypothetical protein